MAGPAKIEEALQNVRDQESFIKKLLIDVLGWPIEDNIEDLEDISYGWTPQELGTEGLDERLAEGQIWQIQPLVHKQPWGVFLLEFKHPDAFTKGRGMTGPLRKLLRGLVAKRQKDPDIPSWKRENLLFICTHKYNYFSFAYFKSPKKDKGLAPLAAFGWGPDTPARTACEFNLPALAWPDDGIAPEKWVAKWASAFDIEKVTKEFFKEYARVFGKVEGLVHGFLGPKAPDQKRLFTQRLFNRLMFITFIQKKGWLKFDSSANYLSALWNSYSESKGGAFYNDRLKLLFFQGLNTPNDVNIIGINRGGILKDIIGKVPYLNGGLFEQDEDDLNEGITVPDECFSPIFDGLFNRFNFTVMESTPLDIEVAVDPEMLGKVFEELVTGRHETGSYYTPKPVVSFMCREALKGYLASSLSKESAKAFDSFVDDHDPSGLKNPEAALDALRAVKVCDPACGSGAYLVGMLHELLDLRHALFAFKEIDPRTVYERKLEIIENSLYGVDIDPFAVNIARLRLWLSLVVDYEKRGDPPPLPNLDYKLEVGDSVLGPAPRSTQLDIYENIVKEFRRAKAEYMKAHGGEKKTLHEKIEKLREDIFGWAHPGEKLESFDWAADFAEVFIPRNGSKVTFKGELGLVNEVDKQGSLTESAGGEPGGFDIIVANPPYVRQELIKNIKPALKKTYGDLFQGTADLYYYFYLRSLELLRNGGMLAFISSNKWFRAKYGEKLREHIAKTCGIKSITDFGDLPVFVGATAYPMIFVARKGKEGNIAPMFAQVKSLEPPYPNIPAVIRRNGQTLPKEAISGAQWRLADAGTITRLKKMESAGIPLGKYVQGKIYRGILTGFNKAFVIDGAKRAELIAEDPKGKEIIKPLAEGKDIRKWHVEKKDKWLIFTRRGININDYPAIKAHLSHWRKELTPKTNSSEKVGRKPGDYKWYEIQDIVAYYKEFEKPKIAYPDITKDVRFALDSQRYYYSNTTYLIPVNDMFLLAVLNSSLIEDYYLEISSQIRGGYLRFFNQYVERLPIPNASASDRKAIEKLVQKCLDAKGEGCEEWEKEIDDRVAKLYGL